MIFDDTENRYVVIGVIQDSEAWFVRWSLDSLMSEMVKYANRFSKLYDRMEIWIISNKDEKIRLELSSNELTWTHE